MDIDLLSKMVKELILDNDRVVLPGLGCFVAEIVPATFSDKGYTINPPYRRLFFRSKPDSGELLVKFYASSIKVELPLAERIINDFMAELTSVLHTRKMVIFPGLGRLRATKENNLFFVADENLDIYPAGFALEAISLKNHDESREEVAAAVEGLASILSPVNPTPVPAPDPLPAEEPVHEPANAPLQVPEVELKPLPEVEPLPEPAHKPASDPEPVKVEVVGKGKKIIVIAGGVVAAAVILLAVFVLLAHIAPDFIDRLLYSADDLEVLHYRF